MYIRTVHVRMYVRMYSTYVRMYCNVSPPRLPPPPPPPAQTLVRLKDLLAWATEAQGELSSQAPLADSLEGVRRQKEWHTVGALEGNSLSLSSAQLHSPHTYMYVQCMCAMHTNSHERR